jgi:hypothetical protein
MMQQQWWRNAFCMKWRWVRYEIGELRKKWSEIGRLKMDTETKNGKFDLKVEDYGMETWLLEMVEL